MSKNNLKAALWMAFVMKRGHVIRMGAAGALARGKDGALRGAVEIVASGWLGAQWRCVLFAFALFTAALCLSAGAPIRRQNFSVHRHPSPVHLICGGDSRLKPQKRNR